MTELSVILLADEVINQAIDNRGYAYGSIIDTIDERDDINPNQREALVEYFKELFSHDAH